MSEAVEVTLFGKIRQEYNNTSHTTEKAKESKLYL